MSGIEQMDENRIRRFAFLAHEVNRAYCAALGDFSQPPWTDAPDWQRKSIVNGVIFRLENPMLHPSASHENWLKEKEAAGWRYGPTKDPEKKEHPCFAPYEDLPVEQKAKNFIFLAVVDGLAALEHPLPTP